MKKCSSLVWRFFDRIENENKRCLAVVCKLCDTQYKFFGNTTNLRSHLINKHPFQWDLAQKETLDETNFRIVNEDSNHSALSPRKKKYLKSYKDKNVRYSVSIDNPKSSAADRIPTIEIQRIDVLDTDIEHDNRDNEDTEAPFNLVRQLREDNTLQGTDEEWLEDENYQPVYEPKRKKYTYKKIKREVQTPPRRISHRTVKSPMVIETTNCRDEFSVFGEYVANKLRKFEVPRTRGNLQQLITTILWQAEYGMYDNADAVKKLLMYSVRDPQPEPTMINPEFENEHNEVVIEEQNVTPNETNQNVED